MKITVLAVCLSFGFTGCYTMLYPPPSETQIGYAAGGTLTIPDSLAGQGVTIINQNNMILDRYYEDPFYLRDGYYGGYGYWDPYYYNYRGYNDRHRWHNGRYHDPGTPARPETPKPKKPRRQKDERRSEYPPVDAPNQVSGRIAEAAPPVQTVVVPAAAAAGQPVEAKKEDAKAAEDGRGVKALQPVEDPKPNPQPDTSKVVKEEKKSRRGAIRGK